MEYSSYTAEHLYNKHKVLSNVHRIFLLNMMGTHINMNLNEFRMTLDPILLFSHFLQSWYPVYFENLQREAVKTSKTSSWTKIISICSLNSTHWSDIISWFTNIINLVKNLNLKILSMSTNMYNIKWNVEISH